jgi:hypothetical protein
MSATIASTVDAESGLLFPIRPLAFGGQQHLEDVGLAGTTGSPTTP